MLNWKNTNKLFALMMSPSLLAVESVSTPMLVGHKPTVENVVIDKPFPMFGEELKVNYDYLSVDGDVEGGTIFSWLYNNIETRNTGMIYTPVLDINTGVGNACGNAQVAVEVTPVSLTGFPNRGASKRSSPVTLKLPTVKGFTFPDTAIRTFQSAINYCSAKGGKLPTGTQLQWLFNNMTTGGSNNLGMSQRYGWPLNLGRCGGAQRYYWVSDHSDVQGAASAVNMTNGNIVGTSATYEYHTTCFLEKL